MRGKTLEELRELLEYHPDSGYFYWKKTYSNVLKGERAGSGKDGCYRRIQIDGVNYAEHRLAWAFVTGSWPTKRLDHKNRIKSENWFENLREATHAENLRNQNKRVDNTSGYLGVTLDKASNKWKAYIRLDGKTMTLGRFTNVQEAVAARIAGEEKYFGEFAPSLR